MDENKEIDFIKKDIEKLEIRINNMRNNIQEISDDYDGESEIEIRRNQIEKLKDIKNDYEYYYYHDNSYYEEINNKEIFEIVLKKEIEISEEILERLEIE